MKLSRLSSSRNSLGRWGKWIDTTSQLNSLVHFRFTVDCHVFFSSCCIKQINGSRLVCHSRWCPFHLAHWSSLLVRSEAGCMSCSQVTVLRHAVDVIYSRNGSRLCVSRRNHAIFQNYPSTQSISHVVIKKNLLAQGQNNTHYTCSRGKYCCFVQFDQSYSLS